MYMPNTSKFYKHCQINNIHKYSYAKALHYYLTISCETTNYDEDDKIRQCSVFVLLDRETATFFQDHSCILSQC